MSDMELVFYNCKLYNGLDNMYSTYAEKLETFARARCAEIKATPIGDKSAVAGVKRPRPA